MLSDCHDTGCGARAGTGPARRALVNRTAFGVSAFGFDPWRERPLRGRVAVQQRRPRRAPPDAMVTGPGGENAALTMAPKTSLDRHPSSSPALMDVRMRSNGARHAGGRISLAACGYGGAPAPVSSPRRCRQRRAAGALDMLGVEGQVVGSFRVASTPAKLSFDAVNSVAGKAMALLRRLSIEAVTIPACLSSRKSRAGPFNPPSGKISPAAKSAPLTLRPFG